jgi:hypothetical protein
MLVQGIDMATTAFFEVIQNNYTNDQFETFELTRKRDTDCS